MREKQCNSLFQPTKYRTFTLIALCHKQININNGINSVKRNSTIYASRFHKYWGKKYTFSKWYSNYTLVQFNHSETFPLIIINIIIVYNIFEQQTCPLERCPAHGGRRGDLKEQDPVQRGVNILQEKWCKASWASMKKEERRSAMYKCTHAKPQASVYLLRYYFLYSRQDAWFCEPLGPETICAHLCMQSRTNTVNRAHSVTHRWKYAPWEYKTFNVMRNWRYVQAPMRTPLHSPSALFVSPLTMWSCWTISSL